MTKNTNFILIFSEKQSIRLTYTLSFVFKSKDISYKITSNQSEFNQSELPKINYSKLDLKANISFNPSRLLFDEGIEYKPKINFINNTWLIDGLNDHLSIIFYFLSRYEEYTIKTRDYFGRFEAKESALYKFNQLNKPWCDILVKGIWKELGLNYQIIQNKFSITPTFDIDIAWAYKNKKWWRTIGSLTKSLLKNKDFKARLSVLIKNKKDPYDTYEIIKETATNYPNSILFFLLGDYGKYDKNTHWKNKALKSLIQSFKNKALVGIHPSFNSYLSAKTINKEKARLDQITGESTILSRQHFLRFSLPTTYELLEKQGIAHDYSMGFANHYGFRAGTSFGFPFFNLKTNSITNLTVHPFSYMDGTLKEYMNLSIEEANKTIQNLKREVQSVGGNFSFIWHNHSISNQLEWANWQNTFYENFK